MIARHTLNGGGDNLESVDVAGLCMTFAEQYGYATPD
jgi:hypothetical protein